MQSLLLRPTRRLIRIDCYKAALDTYMVTSSAEGSTRTPHEETAIDEEGCSVTESLFDDAGARHYVPQHARQHAVASVGRNYGIELPLNGQLDRATGSGNWIGRLISCRRVVASPKAFRRGSLFSICPARRYPVTGTQSRQFEDVSACYRKPSKIRRP